MLDWYWENDTCIFTVNGREITRCNESEFDSTLERLLLDYDMENS